jgi:hypothetical protein
MSPIIPASSNGPWRILVLDRDPDDPKWILATVTIPSDVRPALLDAAGTHAGLHAAAAWRPASPADRQLISQLAERDLSVLPTQLERWRQAGVLPCNSRHGCVRGRGSVSCLGGEPGRDQIRAAPGVRWITWSLEVVLR